MNDVSMKPLLSVAIHEAVNLALIDSCVEPPKDLSDAEQTRYQSRKEELRWDIFKLTDEEMAWMDPKALAKNICCRLLGTGGWEVNGVYAGNATPTQILEACVHRPDQDPIGDIKMDLGRLGSVEDEP